MAANVAKIKKELQMEKPVDYNAMGDEESFIGNIDKARECYLRAKFHYEYQENKDEMDVKISKLGKC